MRHIVSITLQVYFITKKKNDSGLLDAAILKFDEDFSNRKCKVCSLESWS